MSETPTTNPVRPYACSVVGRVRDHNEDAVLAKEWSALNPGPSGLHALLVVADGMGGHHNGEWASATAIEALERSLGESATITDVPAALHNAALKANEAVYLVPERSGTTRPGTTLTAAAIRFHLCSIVHIGDSRLYLLRCGELRQITSDDSWAQELVNRGEMSASEADNWVYKNQLTKALGLEANVELSSYSIDLQADDILLLCSDGLTGMLSNAEITGVILKSQSIIQAGEALCAAANAAGGEDNISVVLYCHGRWNPLRTADGSQARPRTTVTSHSSAPTRPGSNLDNQPKNILSSKTKRPWMIPSAIALVVVLLGVGVWLALSRPQRPSPVTENPSGSPSAIVQPQASSKLEMQYTTRDGGLVLRADHAKFVSLNEHQRWNPFVGAVGRYAFKTDKSREDSLRQLSDKANLYVVCPDGTEQPLVGERDNDRQVWSGTLTGDGEYLIEFRGQVTVKIARFIVQSDNPTAVDEEPR